MFCSRNLPCLSQVCCVHRLMASVPNTPSMLSNRGAAVLLLLAYCCGEALSPHRSYAVLISRPLNMCVVAEHLLLPACL